MSSIKNKIKSMLPIPVRRLTGRMANRVRSMGLDRYHRRIYNRSYLANVKKANQQQLESKLSFHAHAIEKGLSHEQLRLGFGETALDQLRMSIELYLQNGYDTASLSYQNALSVLRAYRETHEKLGYNLSKFDGLFSDILTEIKSNKTNLGGIRQIEKSDPFRQNFKEIFESRWSVREYNDTSVDVEKVHKAIRLSMKSPSVCNRQSARVHILTNKKLIRKVLAVQGGFTGYKEPPILLAITSDMCTFLDKPEKNQPYIDGGIFSMSLLLALEFYSLAACPLNAMFTKKRDKTAKKIINIKENEALIMFIAVGNFKPVSKVPKSFRISLKEVIEQHD